MDHYADDLAQLIEHLHVRNVSLFGFSTGGEVARYVGRHGTGRVAPLGLTSAVPPLMLRTEANPEGLPIEAFDGLRAASIADRSTLYRDSANGPFFGFNRPGATPSQGIIDSFWRQGVTAGHKNTYDCVAASSATDLALLGMRPVCDDRLHEGGGLRADRAGPGGEARGRPLEMPLMGFGHVGGVGGVAASDMAADVTATRWPRWMISTVVAVRRPSTCSWISA